MAVTNAAKNAARNPETPARRNDQMLQPQLALLAAAAGIVAAIAWSALLIVHLTGAAAAAEADAAKQVEMVGYKAVWQGLFVVVAISGLGLMIQRSWGLKALLATTSTLLIAGLLHVLGRLLWGEGSWWPRAMPTWLVALPVLGGSLVCVILSVCASTPGSRLRYASVVTASVGGAIALAAVINLIGQKDYIRGSAEMLGRFSLDKRTEAIIESLDGQKVTLTCAYTSTTPDRLGSEFGPRTLELLNDMAEHGRKHGKTITVVNAANDRQRANVVAGLNRRLTRQAQRHIDFLKSFMVESRQIAEIAKRDAGMWQAMGPDAYLQQWALPAHMAYRLQQLAEALTQQADHLQSEMKNLSLPDYDELARQTRELLTANRANLADLARLLKQIGTVPAEVEANRAKVDKALDKCLSATQSLSRTVGGPDEPLPERPAHTLRQFAQRAQTAAVAVRAAAQQLNDIAGQGNAQIVNGSQEWMLNVPMGDQSIRGITPTDLFLRYALILDQMAEEVNTTVPAAKDEYLLKMLEEYRREMLLLNDAFAYSIEATRTNISALSDIDAPSRQLLTDESVGGCFQGVLAPMTALLEAAEKLPALDADTLTTLGDQDNIVLVEVNNKVEAVPFEDVWPLKTERLTPQAGDKPTRLFNGNSAIGWKLLSMTHEPFATVVLTYYEADVDPRQAQWLPQPDISPEKLSTLTSRLKEANFRIEQWNLRDPLPWADELEDDRPAEDRPVRVLLVLAPPEPMPLPGQEAPGRFGDVERKRLTDAIDRGVPAIFLTGFMWPRQTIFGMQERTYAYTDYLKDSWGIEALADHRVVPAVPDPGVPGKFRIKPRRFVYLPLSLFTDHPIGKPLGGQRMLWNDLCPVMQAKTVPEGIALEPLLAIPPTWADRTWVAGNVMDLVRRVTSKEGSLVWPDFKDEDMPIPPTSPGLPVAMAATRDGEKHDKAVRIVVLAAGPSVVDGFIDAPVPEEAEGTGGLVITDPPLANADLVVNSAYWVIGRHQQIAAGPMRAKPIQAVSTGIRSVLWALCVVVAPLGIVALGAMVMLVRRR
ncbi:MAG: hypothetical protein ACYS8X_01480 [Planctomycetota bacterium]|jgi:hypothetical protein